ncbi:transient receptor potential cation channel subfamily M member 2 isoform X3 [Takifugu rubripes]|uniref:transient receptor potential cation channel subfamily M member 2 isoform X3 n=1 Tax=Takifugu rubripes TaxID=31033 RepID=UPI001145B54E|nr:transient receptor potential cation channel subfamily M member 2 isoform X3 [Takifugu rubripes]
MEHSFKNRVQPMEQDNGSDFEYSVKKDFALWMRKNIHKKECRFFDRDKSEDVCKCGYIKSEHVDEAIKPDRFTGQTWRKHRHIYEAPTDAFGDISFSGLGQNTGKYARVSTDTKPEILYQLLTDWWKIPPPNLLISVTGGAKNFHLKARLKKMFHRGLIKVAQTTGAWIITGGTHTGVMKHVGEAVKDYTLSSSVQSQIVAIGIPTWGIIHNRDTLVQAELQGCFPAHYLMDEEGQGRFSCLDNNHTHFLLVDDGTHGHYGVEIELRTRLEKFISRKSLRHKGSNVTIPAVCVVLDGGPGTLNTIYNAMLNGTPCVVFESSGRIADVIAHVAGLPVSRVTIADIKKLMKKFFGQEYDGFTDISIVEWTKKIQDIIRMTHLLSVFRVSEDNHGDVDVAILQALLKASKTKEPFGIHCWKRQLELAIVWNRVDIAETEIFTEERSWKSSDLHDALFLALVGNKPQFVRLLLENGASLREFLQKDQTLRDLYRQLPDCLFRRKLPKSADGISLSHVAVEVKKLLGRFTQLLYCNTAQNNFCSMSEYNLSPSQSNVEMGSRTLIEARADETLRDVGRDFFLWAVVQNNKELAEIAWEQCNDCMSAALAANKILKKMAREESDTDEAQDMLELANHYERHATGVFSEGYKSDEVRSQTLLVHVSSRWGRTTCLQLALEANDKDFVAHSGVQALLTKIWCGELSVDNPVWRVLVCMVFFPLVYSRFLIFRNDEISKRVNENNEGRETEETIRRSTLEANSSGLHLRNPMSTKPLGVWSRLSCLYSSPQVKFYWNIVSYFTFLVLFAVVLMVDFQATPSRLEILLYIWLLTLVFEEVRQLLDYHRGFGILKKAWIYINDIWNILDILSIVLFIIGLPLRLTTWLFYPGKVVLCIDFVVFCLRLMAIFTISRTLGPKIIIVKRMMTDLFFFMFLLSIWVVAYGVAKQGILIDNDDRLEWILRGVLYEPYRILFGDFPTNIDYAAFDIEACSINGTDHLKPKCPVLNENQMPAFPEWLTIIMLCVYLLFANILLLNLLIAIFNFTFQEVQDNTDKIWKFQRYQLIKEYHSRPSAPPPLIIFSHLYHFIWSVILNKDTEKEFQIELSKSQEEEVLSWEALMKDRYLVSLQREQNGNTERRVQETVQKLANITDRLEREDEMNPGAMMKRLAQLEEQVVQSARALQWIIDTLKSQDFAAKDAPTLSFTTDEASGQTISTTEKEDQHHVNARQFHYAGGKVRRFPVPEEKVPWEARFDIYQPKYLSSSDDWDRVDGSDPQDLDKYTNPRGRTGIRGRGALSLLGPNLYSDLVLTRWRDNQQSVLEYLAVQDASTGSLALPGGPTQSEEELPVTLKGTLGNTLYEKLNAKLSDGRKVFGDYVDDCRNTDNAWVEIMVLNIHLDRRSPVLVDVDNVVMSSRGSLEWQELNSKSKLSETQREYLRLVANLHNTRF